MGSRRPRSRSARAVSNASEPASSTPASTAPARAQVVVVQSDRGHADDRDARAARPLSTRPRMAGKIFFRARSPVAPNKTSASVRPEGRGVVDPGHGWRAPVDLTRARRTGCASPTGLHGGTVVVLASEAGEQRRRDRGRHPESTASSTVQRPSPGVGHVGRDAVEAGAFVERLDQQVEQPRPDDRSVLPRLRAAERRRGRCSTFESSS